MKLIDIIFLLIIGACLLVIAGCSERSEPLAIMGAGPALRTWTAQEECDLAHVLAKYPADSVIWTLHDDWARMRREAGFTPPKNNKKCNEEKSTRPTFIS